MPTIPVVIYEDTTIKPHSVGGRYYTFPQKYDIWVKRGRDELVQIVTWYKNGKPSNYGAHYIPSSDLHWSRWEQYIKHPLLYADTPIKGFERAMDEISNFRNHVREYQRKN